VTGDPVLHKLAELSARFARCPDFETLVRAALDGISDAFGYEHSLLLLLDERATHLYTIASHGYDREGVGSEVQMGEGIIGMAASRAEPMRVGNLGQMLAYARTVRRSYEEQGLEAPGREIPLPGLENAESQVAVPAMVLGQLVGVLAIESRTRLAFTPDDEARLLIIGTLLANAIELDRTYEREPAPVPATAPPPAPTKAGTTRVRFFAVDGSTFVNGDYLIKGVAGRILWALLGQHVAEGRCDFTNKEVRLDPSLELPEFRDNLESRLILLKRRLDENGAPIRIEKTGRGRFRLDVTTSLELDRVERDAG
jgi:adenylate cyclase